MTRSRTSGNGIPHREIFVHAAKLVGLFAVLAVLTHISWNMFAPELFGLPSMRMKQAIGLVVFAGVAGTLLRLSFESRRHGQG